MNNSISSGDSLISRKSKGINGEIGINSEPGLPGDKSISHRAILLSAIADGESVLDNVLMSGVTDVMIRGLENLGVRIQRNNGELKILGQGMKSFHSPADTIDCRNSGTTMRLLTGAIAASGISATLDGSEGLRKRPMRRIIEPLQIMGVNIQHRKYHAPLKIIETGERLRSITYSLPVASAQVKSCLLLAGLAAEGTLTLREPAPSRDHTEIMLSSMGVDISSTRESKSGETTTTMRVWQPVDLTPLTYSIPGDISAASFLIVAGTIVPGSKLIIRDVLLNPTRTGLIDVLNEMGANITILREKIHHGEKVGDIEINYRNIQGTSLKGAVVVRMIDEFPIFAVAASVAEGKTVVRDARELRFKESDRISALCGELQKIGVNIQEFEDGFEILGQKQLEGGIVDPHGDHRLAMALAVAGLVSRNPVRVTKPEIMNESFPNFQALFRTLGADMTYSKAD